MKKYFINLVSIGVIVFLFTSCSNKIFFTNDMRIKLDEYDLEIGKVQFYNSNKIVLKRVLPYDSAGITNGAIRFENGKLVNTIIINKNTPGTCEFVEDGLLNMTFEDGDNKYLIFKTGLNGKYYELWVNRDLQNFGQILYDNEKYLIQQGSEKAKLLVKKDQEYILRVQQRIVKGRKVEK